MTKKSTIHKGWWFACAYESVKLPRTAGRADTAFLKKPLTATLPPKGMPAGTEPDYTVGDRVRHVKFGEGTVTDLVKETRDYRVSVTFDAAGPKVMYAAFAKLQKV